MTRFVQYHNLKLCKGVRFQHNGIFQLMHCRSAKKGAGIDSQRRWRLSAQADRCHLVFTGCKNKQTNNKLMHWTIPYYLSPVQYFTPSFMTPFAFVRLSWSPILATLPPETLHLLDKSSPLHVSSLV